MKHVCNVIERPFDFHRGGGGGEFTLLLDIYFLRAPEPGFLFFA